MNEPRVWLAVEAVNHGEDWCKPTLSPISEKEVGHRPNDSAVLMYLEDRKLRVIGIIELL